MCVYSHVPPSHELIKPTPDPMVAYDRQSPTATMHGLSRTKGSHWLSGGHRLSEATDNPASEPPPGGSSLAGLAKGKGWPTHQVGRGEKCLKPSSANWFSPKVLSEDEGVSSREA